MNAGAKWEGGAPSLTNLMAPTGMHIPDGLWDDWGTIGQQRPRSRLGTRVSVNGIGFYAEAIEVTLDEAGRQEVADPHWATVYAKHIEACGIEGPLSTVKIWGREYVVFVFAFPSQATEPMRVVRRRTRQETMARVIEWDLSLDGWGAEQRDEWIRGVLESGWKGYGDYTDDELEARYEEIYGPGGCAWRT